MELQKVNLFLSLLFLAAHSSLLNMVPLSCCCWWGSSGLTCMDEGKEILTTDLMDTRINVKGDTQSGVKTGWKRSVNAAEGIFAWKIMLFQNLWCIYIHTWTRVYILAYVCSVFTGTVLLGYSKELAESRDCKERLSWMCVCFFIAMDFSYSRSFLLNQLNMKCCLWRVG